MRQNTLDELRDQLEDLDLQLIDLVNQREILLQKNKDLRPERADKVLERMNLHSKGALSKETLIGLFKLLDQIGPAGKPAKLPELLVSRKNKPENTVVTVAGKEIGGGQPQLVAGPCAVESAEQVDAAAGAVKAQGLHFLRGGAFKPRTSPYDFQGLGEEGLRLLKQAGNRHGLAVISEIVDPRDLEMAAGYLDVIQIGARNMQNFELLKEAGRTRKPILLKRGLAATIDEFIHAAEYIMVHGNDQIILCERGIRTYEKATRNTLDITAVPLLKQETHLPVMVDVTHSTGRKDLLVPAAKAALAIGADGVMAEVHPNPKQALSDASQQMNFTEFEHFVNELEKSGLYKHNKVMV
ncbi:bifunctional 3-deoxy-7-phosphoheptulonate synthase/chorismate mutase [Fictibacillus enclensis]|uniref:bifunctional 3-deoxy-7-phosphoheptulonate synthase/chorismate mutase n=1 Tax=Fictibacillus enclensis TaxID=1017270 RepID=UPI0025A1DD55|nr:bifunctional 3-deoxy-7-phosphoheptulonate synthase/chorismate mutase [Fictibacillus enclensis]MDM5339418.1 bifunctional 3-deoxy-7-phosphoheptulonate synthase/chorismate mutase [Fictibacillus enclensis]